MIMYILIYIRSICHIYKPSQCNNNKNDLVHDLWTDFKYATIHWWSNKLQIMTKEGLQSSVSTSKAVKKKTSRAVK